MEYWSIQSPQMWENAKRNGYLSGDPTLACWPEFKKAYAWMQEQMLKRLPGYDGSHPVWLWTKRPDLRQRQAAHGTELVLLRIELDPSEVLISDFSTWHFVLNDWTVELFEGEQLHKETSWERIFDLELLRRYEYVGGDYILEQATTGSIPLDKIMLYKTFKSK